jgi:hypothetical protein
VEAGGVRNRAPSNDAAVAKGKLMAFLYQCTPVVLATITVDNLVARYRVDRRTAEYELIVARQKRAGEK